MAFWWIEVLAPERCIERVCKAAREAEVSEIVIAPVGSEPGGDADRYSIRLLAGEIDRQALVDAVQEIIGDSARAIVSETVAVAPKTSEEEDREQAAHKASAEKETTATREEIYQGVVSGAALNRDFLLLVALSTIVAGFGLIGDDIAILIGAMLIAPMIGPNLALAFGTAVGDRKLTFRALRSNAAGLGLAFGLALLFPVVASVDMENAAMSARTEIGFGAIGLALVSGAAAALSITSGVSAALVGVMVAAAILPPVVAAGISFSTGAVGAGVEALLLLGVNCVAVNLSAIAVFLAKGVQPRRWHERKGAAQSVAWTVGALLVALALFALLIALESGVFGNA